MSLEASYPPLILLYEATSVTEVSAVLRKPVGRRDGFRGPRKARACSQRGDHVLVFLTQRPQQNSSVQWAVCCVAFRFSLSLPVPSISLQWGRGRPATNYDRHTFTFEKKWLRIAVRFALNLTGAAERLAGGRA